MRKFTDVDSSALFIKGRSQPIAKLGKPEIDTKPNFRFENELRDGGYRNVAGIDEVGRGPLAGPVVVAAVIPDYNNSITGIDDSKRLSSNKMSLLFEQIVQHFQFSIASISAKTIDDINIRKATLLGMTQAVAALTSSIDWLLIDGNDKPISLDNQATTIVKGDQRSASIAAAAIIAKITRDRMMIEYDRQYPEYGFANNKGYGTKMHMKALAEYGPCPIHRMSFSPCNVYPNKR